MTLLELFNDTILNSVENKGDFKEIGKNKHKYYKPNEYALKVKQIYEANQWDSKEFNKSSKYIPFCSVSSSARLTFEDVSRKDNYDGVEFETKLYNDFCSIAPTKMDVIVDSKCYECKCQEVVDGEKEVFRKSYLINKKSILFKEFNIEKGKVEIKDKLRKDGTINYSYLSFSCKNLNIDINKDYSDLHFNLKQLICHLIAMANSERKLSQLQYVIYIPKIELININDELIKLYTELIREIDMIFDPNTEISKFAKRHNIEISRPIYKVVDSFQTVDNFEELFRR